MYSFGVQLDFKILLYLKRIGTRFGLIIIIIFVYYANAKTTLVSNVNYNYIQTKKVRYNVFTCESYYYDKTYIILLRIYYNYTHFFIRYWLVRVYVYNV